MYLQLGRNSKTGRHLHIVLVSQMCGLAFGVLAEPASVGGCVAGCGAGRGGAQLLQRVRIGQHTVGMGRVRSTASAACMIAACTGASATEVEPTGACGGRGHAQECGRC